MSHRKAIPSVGSISQNVSIGVPGAGIDLANSTHMIETNLSSPKRTTKNINIKCTSCGNDIFPQEIYYTFCVHTEFREPGTDEVKILEITPLAFRCRLCEESGKGTC